jgi:hypothetical protein
LTLVSAEALATSNPAIGISVLPEIDPKYPIGITVKVNPGIRADQTGLWHDPNAGNRSAEGSFLSDSGHGEES